MQMTVLYSSTSLQGHYTGNQQNSLREILQNFVNLNIVCLLKFCTFLF